MRISVESYMACMKISQIDGPLFALLRLVDIRSQKIEENFSKKIHNSVHSKPIRKLMTFHGDLIMGLQNIKIIDFLKITRENVACFTKIA